MAIASGGSLHLESYYRSLTSGINVKSDLIDPKTQIGVPNWASNVYPVAIEFLERLRVIEVFVQVSALRQAV